MTILDSVPVVLPTFLNSTHLSYDACTSELIAKLIFVIVDHHLHHHSAGGTGISEQIAELKRGAEIIVCTPGRMIDMLAANSGKVRPLHIDDGGWLHLVPYQNQGGEVFLMNDG